MSLKSGLVMRVYPDEIYECGCGKKLKAKSVAKHRETKAHKKLCDEKNIHYRAGHFVQEYAQERHPYF